MSDRVRWRKGYTSPFPRNHCAVDALAQLANKTPDQAVQLAKLARTMTRGARTTTRDFPWRQDQTLLTASGAAYIWMYEDAQRWAMLAGVSISHPIYYEFTDRASRPAPTLAQFCRAHGKGRYLVLVSHGAHAVAVINGRAYGSSKPRARVARALAITLTEAP